MDPDACLALIIDAAHTGDPDALEEHAHNLAVWLRAGGYAPGDPR